MVQLGVFRPVDPLVPMFFNVNSSVGRFGSNSSREDILLVQYLIKKTGERNPASTPTAKAEIETMKKVTVSGKVDEATIQGIEAVQTSLQRKFPGTVVDGRVSVARHYKYGSAYFTISGLNAFFRRLYGSVWPRLHDLADCPADLKKRVSQIL